MRTVRWTAGLLRRRGLEVAVAAASIALTFAFVASMGAFVVQSRGALTTRAAAAVPVDWQVQVTAQGDPRAVADAVARLPGIRAAEPVTYAKVDGLRAADAAGARTTGSAYVVGLPPGYGATFPSVLRHLVGSDGDVRLLQQTAANLAAGPGARVEVLSRGRARAVVVDQVVDLPSADSFFQVVGLPPGAGASAPPDNVLLVPASRLAGLVGQAEVVRQLHVGFAHEALPADPPQAAVAVQERANRFAADVAGAALVGDNLGARLTAAGEDATYANLLFLLLGLPGLALAAVVAWLVVALRSDRRRRETALLRLRGATTGQVAGLVLAEAATTAALGLALGVPLAALAVRLALPRGAGTGGGWTLAAAAVALALALGTQLAPLVRRRTDGSTSVSADALRAPEDREPWPLRGALDVVLLLGAGTAFALTARGGYQVVLAPEGIPQAQVNFAALLGPLLAWPGLALLVWRLTRWSAGHRTGRWSRDRPGRAPELEAAAVRRRRAVVARGAVGLAAAVGLVMSTAVFTDTYRAQARVDVALTVGSDVAVVEPPGASAPPSTADDLRRTPGVSAVEPLVHRFAYVGADLQDLYGVRAQTFASAAPLQDAFVPGSTVPAALAGLASTPDGVLLSAETLKDYQLHPGDLIRLRLQTGRDRAYRPVDFHVLGQVSEWPTAPKDSFIVANADYLARVTGSDTVSAFLVATPHPAEVASALRARLLGSGSAATVLDTVTGGSSVTSATGLAATDLTGLSRLELGFGVLFALASSGLALLGGIVERRRALVLLAALGAEPRQRRRFLYAEATATVVNGLAGGLLIGATLAFLLIKTLTGIFDPPPAYPSVPWSSLAGLIGLVALTTVGVVSLAGRLVARAGPAELRDL